MTNLVSDSGPFRLPPERRHPHERHPDTPGAVPYLASNELVEAVNLAIFLNRPLLLEGEAGSGKSQLAVYVAHSLGLPLFAWAVRSTSKAQDGLYSYDAILRLHDVHLAQKLATVAGRDPQHPLNYVAYGAIGEAFRIKDCPAVVLIDEIDKADIDFPNDLLTVLDEPRSFVIREAGGEPITAVHPPIVIITSNKEKGNLPAPFLRRCIYHFIRFPSDPAQLKKILAAHDVLGATDSSPEDRKALVDTAVDRFLGLRERDDLFKKPGTSELLDWLKALGRNAEVLAALVTRIKDAKERLPYPEVLFKLRADWQRYVLGN
jgi:MoxR-like ATPase